MSTLCVNRHLSLLSNTVPVWNTVHMTRLVPNCVPRVKTVLDEDLACISPRTATSSRMGPTTSARFSHGCCRYPGHTSSKYIWRYTEPSR
jgi:hypothetical protein